MLERTGLMTIDEFVRRYDKDGPFELIDGECVPVGPTVIGHTMVIKLVYSALLLYEQAPQGGEVFSEAIFVIEDTPNWVQGSRIPDLMFIRAERLAAYREATPDWAEKPLILVPDLVVEVVSKNDSYEDIYDKVERYLADGVQLVWVFAPKPQHVTIHQSGSKQKTRSIDDTLTGGDVLPGFELSLATIFSPAS